MKRFPFGARLKHVLRIEIDDELEDPNTVSVYFVNPSGVQEGPSTPTREATGQYYFTKAYTASDASGDWYIKWIGSGVADGNEEHPFHINTSPFTV